MPFFKKPLAGPGYIILNVLQIINIIGLLAVIAASAVMLVKTFVVSKFFFFDAVSHVITASIAAFLIVSELSLFQTYFARNWPLLSHSSGFVALGTAMVFLGVSLLGNLNKQATSQKSLGLPFWRIVISSGILILVLGVINIISNYIFRDTKAHVTAREIRSLGVVAAQSRSASITNHGGVSAGSPKPYLLNRQNTLPSYHSHTEGRASPPRLPLKISSPINFDRSQFQKFERSKTVARPSETYHPVYSEKF
ncbi:MAG: hypothetical protein M1812_005606 [Candelaria pacifica]|nr:MAG: hypothetical protein M1812_005606 [Candelaria pacifica]